MDCDESRNPAREAQQVFSHKPDTTITTSNNNNNSQHLGNWVDWFTGSLRLCVSINRKPFSLLFEFNLNNFVLS
jgi:hypothetical protein